MKMRMIGDHRHSNMAMVLAAVVSAAFLLASCATTELRKFDDASDACGGYRRTIIAAKETQYEQRIRSAMVGAAIGAVGTVLFKGLRGDDIRGSDLAIAILVGGLTGYSAAYFQEKQKNAQTKAQLLRNIDADARDEVVRLDGTATAVRGLRRCRSNEVRQIRTAYQKQRIDKAAARKRLAEVEHRITDDNRLITQAIEGTENRVSSYVEATAATEQLNQDLTAPPTVATKKKRTKPTRKMAKTSPNVVQSHNKVVKLKDVDTAAKSEVMDDVQSLKVLLG